MTDMVSIARTLLPPQPRRLSALVAWSLALATGLLPGCGSSERTSADPAGRNQQQPPSRQQTPAVAKSGETASTPTEPGSSEKNAAPSGLSEEVRDAVRHLASRDAAQRDLAGDYLAGQGDARRELLLRAMEDPDAEVRAGAAFALLGEFDPAQDELVKVFLEAAGDDDLAVRKITLRAVADMHPDDAARALPSLIEMLGEKQLDSSVRAQVARTIGTIGEAAAKATEALSKALAESGDRGLSTACLTALKEVAPPEARANTIGRAARQHADPSVRRTAVRALASLGADKDAAATLAAALHDSDAAVRGAAARAIRSQGQHAVAPLARTVAESDSPQARLSAIVALANLGPAARPAADALRKAAADPDASIARAAQAALRQIGAAP